MSLAPRDPLPADPPAPPAVPTSPLTRLASAAVLALLVAFIGVQLRTLWGEWNALRAEWGGVSQSAVVGYRSISPNPCYAQRPENWFHHDAQSTLLWAGWRPGRGHLWFRVGRGELDRSQITPPFGRDVVQAIDDPLLETGGGPLWSRIPDEHQVVGLNVAGIPCAYPLIVLRKVEVINDRVAERPLLIACMPFVPDAQAVDAFDPVLDGRRLTFGSSGYFDRTERKPLLYDRGTESLWLARDEALQAVAGPLKGAQLRRVAHLTPVPWGDWSGQHPQSRLVVGANRSRGLPEY